MRRIDYGSLVEDQRSYFEVGKTRPVSWRVEQLKAIKADPASNWHPRFR
jgi:hypothetical protein